MTKLVTTRPVAQGDILIIPCDGVPDGARAAEATDGKFVIAHSETGHHHVVDRARAEVFEAADDAFVAYIRTLGQGAEVVHERGHDTHETVALEPNRTYQVRRQREYVPEGFRRAQD